MSRGYLISFEGLDGAGKTTQMDLLADWLQARGIKYIRTREPGGTPLGVEIRRLLFHHPELTITPLAEAFLFQADRAQHFATVVLPALEQGTLVLSDRCFDSSIAYQGAARGVGTEL
ncbi:MAG TPA: dTMP kinase, partial [Ktedonobacteraceae bacterium]|nr:dTMP kinase [Ktedonobacteraceae bacterium]